MSPGGLESGLRRPTRTASKASRLLLLRRLDSASFIKARMRHYSPERVAWEE